MGNNKLNKENKIQNLKNNIKLNKYKIQTCLLFQKILLFSSFKVKLKKINYYYFYNQIKYLIMFILDKNY